MEFSACVHCVCRKKDQAEIKRSVGIMQKSGDLLLSLLSDILTFSKNQVAHGLSLNESEFCLADISSQVISIFEKQAKDSLLNLRVSFHGWKERREVLPESRGDPSLEPPDTDWVRDVLLLGDEQRVLQVIINLVSNGLKFTPAGGSVEVRLKCLDFVEKKTSAPSSRRESIRQTPSTREQGYLFLEKPGDHGGAVFNSRSFTPLRDNEQGAAGEISRSESNRRISVRESPSIDISQITFDCEVRDTGPGIPESQRERIFEPFVQGDLGLTKKHQGTGLA